MKSFPLFTLMLVLCLTNTYSQTYLDINKIKAGVELDRGLFWNGGKSLFEVPIGSKKSTVAVHSIWMGGYNNNELYLEGQQYGQMGMEMTNGPVSNKNFQEWHKWQKIWKLSHDSINMFLSDCKDGKIDNVIPKQIIQWPGKNNPNLTLSPLGEVAPFVDVNGDGKYNPADMDYPLMKGDLMLWYLQNDSTDHPESMGKVIGAQIAVSVYAYRLSDDSVLDNTIFVSYSIRNVSQKDYTAFRIGTMTDFDLGGYEDDYIGSDSLSSSYFAYNGDSLDAVYGKNIPVQSVEFLNKKMTGFMTYNNDFSPTGNPGIPNDFYNYLGNYRKDGTSINVKTHFMLNGNPGLPWPEISECSSNSKAGDRRGLGAIGEFTFKAGDTINIDMALITHWNMTTTCPDITYMRKDIRHVDSIYAAKADLAFLNNVNHGANLKVYPNPSNGKFTLEYTANNSNTAVFSIYNLLGQPVLTKMFEPHRPVSEEELSINLKGVYLYKLETNGTVMTGKLMVQ